MSFIEYQPYVKKHLDSIHFYSPFIPALPVYKERPSTKLKIGVICSDRVYQGLKYDAEVFLLTEKNWKDVLKYIDIDFLLVESCLKSLTGHWVLSQVSQAFDHNHSKGFKDIIEYSNKHSIPTVYWFTQDHVYHDIYKQVAKLFDFVFCCDPDEIELLQKDNVTSELLLPAVQPALYNPFKSYQYYSSLDIGVLFDGWSDMFRNKKILELLNKLRPHGLKIIDSKKEIFRNRIKDYSNFSNEILGCLSVDTRRTLLKYSKAVISFPDTLLTKTSQQWDALEVAATRVNLIYRGELHANDIRKNIVVEEYTDEAVLLKLTCFEEDKIYRERLAHKAWREVNLKHTFNNRLKKICTKLKIDFKERESFSATIVTPTYRASKIPDVVDTYSQQTFKNKEIIIVYNGSDPISDATKSLCKKRDNILLVTLPPENSVGSCLNLGHRLAKGEYCFRMDDDDMYAPNYILDMMLYLKYMDFDLFGRPPGYLTFEGDDRVFVRESGVPPLSIVDDKTVLLGKVYMGGNTIGGKTSFLVNNPYPEKSFGAADTSFTYEACEKAQAIMLMDSFNMLIKRNKDTTKHTWRINYEELKKKLNSNDINSCNDVII